MILSSYLQKNGLTYESFGALVGITSTSVYRYAKGIRFPKRNIIAEIEKKTNGAITFEDFLREEEERKSTRRKNGKGHRP